ncbi:MAG: DUF7948 domain-containing protein [Bacteroidia bacterium]
MRKYYFLFTSFCLIAGVNAQTSFKKNWMAEWQPSKLFIENKGQFSNVNGSPVLYASDHDYCKIYFSRKGLSYILFGREEEGKANERFSHENEEEERKSNLKSERINLEWVGANTNAQIIAEDAAREYFNYSLGKESVSNIKGFKKITYVNLYPNIDVVYTFHPTDGIKYALTLKPGADLSLVKMEYSGAEKLSIKNNGDLLLKTELGNIIDHAPITFYESNNSELISSTFIKNGNTISFALKNYDHSKTVIVDPWTQTSTLPASNCIWECERDSSGNVYAIGGDHPMRLVKFNSSGTLQWVFATTYDTSSCWLGTIATDRAGNSYVTSGSTAAITKVNSSGVQIYSVTGGSNDEYWSLAFNCDETKLVAGGTTLNGSFHGKIFEINPATGTVTSSNNVSGVIPGGFGINDPNEVRSFCAAGGDKFYFLTLDSIGAVDQSIAACPSLFKTNSKHNLSYKCDYWKPKGNSGIMAIKANKNFLYTHRGDTIYKRFLSNGGIISSALIPGGMTVISSGFIAVQNSGLDIDNCGNIYAGSHNALIKYDEDLNLLSSTSLPFSVYDVAVNNNGEVIVGGATGNLSSTARTGYVQSINMGACAPIKFGCCDANICAAGPYCSLDSPDTLSPVVAGGSWSGTGVNANGVFDPSAAGPGVHQIVYTLPCGKDSIEITVKPCVALPICFADTVLQVSGGVPTYTWSAYHSAGTTSITTQAECTACNSSYSWFFGQCLNGSTPVTTCTTSAGWTTIGTGSTVPIPTTMPIKVVDSYGNSGILNALGDAPNCGGCGVSTAVTQNSNVITANQNGATYQWLACSSGTLTAIAGATNQSYTIPSNGNYAVIVTVGSCTDTSICFNTGGVAINQVSGITKIGIYPNPNEGVFSVVTNEVATNIIVVDVLGNEILNLIPDHSVTRVNLAQQPNGVYFIKVITGKNQVTKKILVNK